MALPWKEKGEISLSVPLLRAEGGEEEAQVCLEAAKDGALLELAPTKPPPADACAGITSCRWKT